MAEEKSTILTESGLQKLKDQLDYLISVRRNEISEQIAIARGFGDLSENAEYDEARERLSRQGAAKEQARKAEDDAAGTTENRTYKTYEDFMRESAAFVNAILAEINLPGVSVEICGSWIWLDFSGKPAASVRDTLKAVKYRWASKKARWYWHDPEDGWTSNSRGTSMQKIRAKYGSVFVEGEKREALEA